MYADLWAFFLTCFYAVLLSYNVFPAWLGITHIIKEMFVYIHTCILFYYSHIGRPIVFPCLQDLARLKIALNILAHVPESLLDPGQTLFFAFNIDR